MPFPVPKPSTGQTPSKRRSKAKKAAEAAEARVPEHEETFFEPTSQRRAGHQGNPVVRGVIL